MKRVRYAPSLFGSKDTTFSPMIQHLYNNAKLLTVKTNKRVTKLSGKTVKFDTVTSIKKSSRGETICFINFDNKDITHLQWSSDQNNLSMALEC